MCIPTDLSQLDFNFPSLSKAFIFTQSIPVTESVQDNIEGHKPFTLEHAPEFVKTFNSCNPRVLKFTADGLVLDSKVTLPLVLLWDRVLLCVPLLEDEHTYRLIAFDNLRGLATAIAYYFMKGYKEPTNYIGSRDLRNFIMWNAFPKLHSPQVTPIVLSKFKETATSVIAFVKQGDRTYKLAARIENEFPYMTKRRLIKTLVAPMVCPGNTHKKEYVDMATTICTKCGYEWTIDIDTRGT